MKTTVIFHSADWDGQFCREIARKFLPSDTEFIGWDFADNPLTIPDGKIYVLDLPVDRVFGFDFLRDPIGQTTEELFKRIVWLDHHKSSIESHPASIPGYRIDGVSAARLAWQWFSRGYHDGTSDPDPLYPTPFYYIERKVPEPLAVRLAGEYDVGDQSHGEKDWQDCLAFQFGLDALVEIDWDIFLEGSGNEADYIQDEVLPAGRAAMRCYAKRDARIAVKHGGGGNKSSAIFTCNKPPFLP